MRRNFCTDFGGNLSNIAEYNSYVANPNNGHTLMSPSDSVNDTQGNTEVNQVCVDCTL